MPVEDCNSFDIKCEKVILKEGVVHSVTTVNVLRGLSQFCEDPRFRWLSTTSTYRLRGMDLEFKTAPSDHTHCGVMDDR